MKVWPIIFVCQAKGTVHFEVMHDYGTKACLIQWRHYKSLRGNPGIIVSGQGSQLTSSKNLIAISAKEDPTNWDWTRISQESLESGTQWKFVPAGCQYRNGQAERMVHMTKRMLAHMLANTMIADKQTLNYAELQTILTKVANVTNDHPIGVRNLTEEDLLPLTPNHLLIGRVSMQTVSYNKPGDIIGLDGLKEYHREILRSWWSMWREQVFPKLFKFYDWAGAKMQDDLKVGDIYLLNYKDKVSSHFCLCIIIEAKPSEDALVCTVQVALRNRRAKSGCFLPREKLNVGVQRLVLVLPVAESNRPVNLD